MQRHCREHHNWINDWKKGGHIKAKMQEPRQLPWSEGISCQRLFRSRAASSWFEVKGAANIQVSVIENTPRADGEVSKEDEGQAAILAALDEWDYIQEQRYTDGQGMRRIEELDPKNEANSWLQRVGWTRHLEGLEVEELQQINKEPAEEEMLLQYMSEQCHHLLDEAYKTCRSYRIGLPAMFEINRREVSVQAKRPFEPRMEADSWSRYKGVICKIIRIIYRTKQRPREERPPYTMTSSQQRYWKGFVKACRQYQAAQEYQAAMTAKEDGGNWGESSASESNGSSTSEDISRQIKESQESCRDMCARFIIAMLDHALGDHQYDSVLISALAVMGVREDGGWHNALDYTPVLSAVIKVARIVVLYHIYNERQGEVRAIMEEKGIQEAEARQFGTSMFARTRQCIHRFMTRTGKETEEFPSPMDWMLETRTYGMKIRFTTTAGGVIDWIGDQVIFRRIRFTMAELSGFMHAVLQEARSTMAELAMCGDEGIHALPAIAWDDVYDDNSNDAVGYTFIKDDRNTPWVEKGKGYIKKRLVQCERQRKAWLQQPDMNNQQSGQPARHPYREKKAREYGRSLDRFREKLLVLMHMVSGQPARATEILTVRMENTANAGTRNIFVSHGQLCFVTAYHKNFQQSDQVKIIHRFMPPEVGELLVWYVWLVLPFWQSVQGIIKQSTFRSAYIWADEITSRNAIDQAVDRDTHLGSQYEIEDAERAGESAMQPFREGKWSSDRVRRIIQQHSERLLGCKLSTSGWRQIAIAISNRYLGTKHDPSYHGENGEDEDGIDDAGVDDARDLMAGHTSHVAGMIYAREMQQGLGGTAMMREKFREVSREWHQIFDFGQEGSSRDGVQGEATAAAQQRRQRNKLESNRQSVRLRRLDALRQVDIAAMLRCIQGKAATFRPGQRQAISAVVRGESPVVQITPTGGGKSMSFMLPAYCSQQGRTIVIVPLVSLQEDIRGECMKHGVEAGIWNSKTGVHQGSRIILVITEAVFTAAFQHFIQRLQNQFAIDRVVVDECHTILDGIDTFRPALRDVGREIALWGVQRVFLTATLRPSEETEFFARAHINPGSVVMFRGQTTRRNIQYRVVFAEGEKGASDQHTAQQEAEDRKAMEIAQDWIKENKEGRVIIYASTIPRTKDLAEALGVDAYYNKAGSREEKQRRMQSWRTTRRLIVATNALGLGINVQDVRLVIHVGLPYQVRAFAQESGRLGRDGRQGASVIVCKAIKGQQGFTQGARSARDEEIVEYIRGTRCRRFVLDKAMDGRIREGGCQEDEEMCDVCIRGGQVQERSVMAIRHIVSTSSETTASETTAGETTDSAATDTESNTADEERGHKRRRIEENTGTQVDGANPMIVSPNTEIWRDSNEPRSTADKHVIHGREEEEIQGARIEIYMQEREQEFAIWKESERIRDNTLLTDIFEQQLADWSEGCIYCRMTSGEYEHEEICPLEANDRKVFERIERNVKQIQEWMGRKGSFERFCGCWECGLPYRICNSWEEIYGDGGKFRRIAGGKCQYPDIMAKMIGAGLSRAREVLEYIFRQIGKIEEGKEVRVDEMLRIGGRRRKNWGGMETNEMCVGLSMLMDWFNED
jgi:superfamily II DNA helicase RecQ